MLRLSKKAPIIMGFLLLILIVWLSVTSYAPIQQALTRLGYMAYDLQLYTGLSTHAIKHKGPIVVVTVDEKSLSEQGRWPWSRSKIAKLIDNLQSLGAAVVGMDMYFAQPQTNEAEEVKKALRAQNIKETMIYQILDKIVPSFDSDTIFAETLKKSQVILGGIFLTQTTQTYHSLPKPIFSLKTPIEKSLSFFKAQGFLGNLPLLQEAAAGVGFINVFHDEDGVIRRVPLVIRYGDDLYASLALAAVQHYLFNSPIKLVTASYGDSIRLEGIEIAGDGIPTDPKAQILVPYIGGAGTFPYFSATDILNGKIPANEVKDKIVFLGVSAIGLGDLQTMPLQSGYPGVEVHATIANSILEKFFYIRPPWALGAELILTVMIGTLLIFVFPYLGAALLAVMTVGIPVTLILLNGWLWSSTGLVLSMLMPVLFTIVLAIMNLVYGFLFESRRRERIQEMFGQYVPPKHIDQMLKTLDSYGMLGEDRNMTVLFADIRNFTSISESRKASDVKEFLNQFLTPMTQVIFNHQGTVDKYVGDLIMAFWGAPLQDDEHARHALSAALDMQKALDKLNPVLAKQNWPEIRIGIGLNTGLMTVGDMGSQFRRNYTVLGDSVNLASRLESLTKFYGVKIIVSEYTCDGQNDFVFRLLDRVKVKGKEEGVYIYELKGLRSELNEALQNQLQLNARALTYYFEQRWEEARQLFTQLNQNYPDDLVYRIYLSRIAEYQVNPPDKEWDGVYTHHEK